MKMFVKVYMCAQCRLALLSPSLSLLLLQYMMHFEIPLKTSVFDTRRVKERRGERKKENRTVVSSSISHYEQQIFCPMFIITTVSMFLFLSSMISIFIYSRLRMNTSIYWTWLEANKFV